MNPISLSDKSQRPKAHISLTPLIDVVFILLLFFMLSSTFSPLSALNIHSASLGASDQAPEKKPVMIQVVGDQQWLIDSVAYTTDGDDLRTLLEKTQTEKAPVVVRAGTDAKVQHLVTALTLLQKYGIDQLNWGNSLESDDVR